MGSRHDSNQDDLSGFVFFLISLLDLFIAQHINLKVGCLMSSVSMALNGHNITVDGAPANPGTLNKWLLANGGYVPHNDLVESAVDKLSPTRIVYVGKFLPGTQHKEDELSPKQAEVMLQAKQFVVIANVMHGEHFVLVTGYNAETTSDKGRYW